MQASNIIGIFRSGLQTATVCLEQCTALFSHLDQADESDAEPANIPRAEIFALIESQLSEQLRRFPSSVHTLSGIYSLASALIETGQDKQAISWCLQGMANHPHQRGREPLMQILAYTYFKRGEKQKSLKLLQQLLKQSDDENIVKTATFLMAQIKHSQGHNKQALALYKRVLDDYQDAREILKLAHSKMLRSKKLQIFSANEPVKIWLQTRTFGICTSQNLAINDDDSDEDEDYREEDDEGQYDDALYNISNRNKAQYQDDSEDEQNNMPQQNLFHQNVKGMQVKQAR